MWQEGEIPPLTAIIVVCTLIALPLAFVLYEIWSEL